MIGKIIRSPGTGLNLGPNAIKALLGHDPKLHAAVLERSYPWKRWRTSLTDGTVLFDLALSRVADNDGVRIRWSELYAALRNEAQGLIRYGAKVSAVGYGTGNDQLPFVEYTDSTGHHRIDNIDLLLATDGRYSLARESLAGMPVMRQHGVVIFRLLVPDTSAGLIDDYEQWFNGNNRLLAFRVPATRFTSPVLSRLRSAPRLPTRQKHRNRCTSSTPPPMHARPLNVNG